MALYSQHCHCNVALPPFNGVVSSRSSSLHLRCSQQHPYHHLQHRKKSLVLLQTSTSFISGDSSYGLRFSPLQPRAISRAVRRSQSSSLGIIRAAFIFEWIGGIIKFITKAPLKLLAERLEADLDKAAKMIKTGASIVVEVAKEADEIAEKVESVAERAGEIADKVAKTTDTIEERVDEILDVIEGEKKVVVTSYKLVDNQSEVAVTSTSTSIAQDGKQSSISVQTSLVNDSSSDKTTSPP